MEERGCEDEPREALGFDLDRKQDERGEARNNVCVVKHVWEMKDKRRLLKTQGEYQHIRGSKKTCRKPVFLFHSAIVLNVFCDPLGTLLGKLSSEV